MKKRFIPIPMTLDSVRRKKSPRVALLLQRISRDIPRRSFKIVDTAPADLLSICLAHPRDQQRLVYILCSLRRVGRYSFDCEEAPRDPGESMFHLADHGEDVTYTVLIRAIKQHLFAES